jgi:hypothetical protein
LNDHIGTIRWTVNSAADTPDESRDDVKIAEAKRNLVKAWTRRRDKAQTPWSKTDWVGRTTGTASHTRAAFEELVDGGRIESIDGNRDRGSKYRLVVVPGEVL